MENDITLPFQCENINCKCYGKDGLLRHCSICGSLFLYNEDRMEPCADCITTEY